MRKSTLAVSFAVCAAVATPAIAEDGPTAYLSDVGGAGVGTVTISVVANGLIVVAALSGLPAGDHAFHIHGTGACAPSFGDAGGHLNVDGAEHGIENEAGMHAGDMPNIHVPENGELTIEYFLPGLDLAWIMDADGSAIVIHEGADDYVSDPAGDAGSRIACGVLE